MLWPCCRSAWHWTQAMMLLSLVLYVVTTCSATQTLESSSRPLSASANTQHSPSWLFFSLQITVLWRLFKHSALLKWCGISSDGHCSSVSLLPLQKQSCGVFMYNMKLTVVGMKYNDIIICVWWYKPTYLLLDHIKAYILAWNLCCPVDIVVVTIDQQTQQTPRVSIKYITTTSLDSWDIFVTQV